MSACKRILAALALLVLVARGAHAQAIPKYYQGSSAAEGSHLFSGTTLYGITVSWNAATTARYLMIFDSNSTSTTSATPCSVTQVKGCLAYCVYMSTSGTAPDSWVEDWVLHPISTQYGIVVAASTGAGCGTFAVDGANDFFYAQAGW
jgi:hypothetical protein